MGSVRGGIGSDAAACRRSFTRGGVDSASDDLELGTDSFPLVENLQPVAIPEHNV